MWIKEWHGLYKQDYWNTDASESERAFEVELFKRIASKIDTIIELGAGYGTWCLAASALNSRVLCIAVEAEPTHYKWLQEAFQYNHIDGITINRVIHDGRKLALFATGKADSWYGQSVIEGASGNWKRTPIWKWRLIRTTSLKQLISRATGRIYINSDIQSSERFIFGSLPTQVTNLHISTHSAAIHIDLRRHLSHQFRVIVDYPPGYKDSKLELGDGILELERCAS